MQVIRIDNRGDEEDRRETLKMSYLTKNDWDALRLVGKAHSSADFLMSAMKGNMPKNLNDTDLVELYFNALDQYEGLPEADKYPMVSKEIRAASELLADSLESLRGVILKRTLSLVEAISKRQIKR